MQHLRIEYPSSTAGSALRHSFAVPDVTTALVVAQINHPEGAVELWDGDRQIAVLENHASDLSGNLAPLWRVG